MKTTGQNKLLSRDGELISPWQAAASLSTGTPTNPMEVFDCLVIGAGITGLTAALLLQNAGRKVVIADAHSPGFGTTGGTSAYINTFADTTYKDAQDAFGKNGAQLFADAINEGYGLIKANVTTYRIDCDYESKTGYIYAEDEKQAEQLNDIFEGTKAVGVPVEYTTYVPTPLSFRSALAFDGQAQFHPLKYLQALVKSFLDAGGVILENTKIDTLETEDGLHIGIAGEQR